MHGVLKIIPCYELEHLQWRNLKIHHVHHDAPVENRKASPKGHGANTQTPDTHSSDLLYIYIKGPVYAHIIS